MKEPLYRGKRIDNDEWVYGWYAPLVCNDRIVIPSIKDSNGSDWRVKRETVGQFTGLTDKNGKNIFEGDILQEGLQKVVVHWNEGQVRWGIYLDGYEIAGFVKASEKYFEVVGNVYNN